MHPNDDIERFIRGQFDVYKTKYELNTSFNFVYNDLIFFASYEYDLHLDTIFIKENPKCGTRRMLLGLLHEFSHAIQRKRLGIDIEKYNNDFSYRMNIEIAAEKFAKKEYYRNYSHIKDNSGYCISATRYRVSRDNIKKKTMKYYDKKMRMVTEYALPDMFRSDNPW